MHDPADQQPEKRSESIRKGFEKAEQNKEWGHWSIPGLISQNLSPSGGNAPECYETITKEYILNKVKEDI